MQEIRVWSFGQEDPLEKGMATHSSVLAWRIPWTEEPGRLQPWGCRLNHDWSINTQVSIHRCCWGKYLRENMGKGESGDLDAGLNWNAEERRQAWLQVLQTAEPSKKGLAKPRGSLQEWACLSIPAVLPLAGRLPGRCVLCTSGMVPGHTC